MTLIDNLIGATGKWVASTDPKATLGSPMAWLRKTGGYAAVNRIIGLSIPFAPRNGFSVEEVRPGYVRARIRLKGNKNHFGSLYAGAYFLVAEIPGGVLTLFDLGPAYTPILKEMTLQFLQPANSDVTVEFSLSPETVAAILADADETGRAKFTLEGKLTDQDGNHVATSIAHYRVRKKGFKADD
ncbi:PaaI family thioesterase [Marinobacter subterrani]|uniref:Acyl-coenzyme A thioesterase PaaI, contains HGG motif n=1 Tax=Marinobacter subterrani TaxID=1658765 RepID=A0A0J7J8A9_9GAMM|nr:YiiD C-terminal domain-containing protein [Marinobacter subterrani]KMQ74432.1 Acyl-coenzyme A thioesterase PaaI, contains HGG motif [Marinobacter subterrani]